ncbi:hypothetical protein [Streptomyces sp. bgisy159]|uniref:hypothetical protein n=1 Tax=Streptomyces sp. bgisy159 TaxID=3413795 RepID=UPI003F4A0A2F
MLFLAPVPAAWRVALVQGVAVAEAVPAVAPLAVVTLLGGLHVEGEQAGRRRVSPHGGRCLLVRRRTLGIRWRGCLVPDRRLPRGVVTARQVRCGRVEHLGRERPQPRSGCAQEPVHEIGHPALTSR